MGCLKRSTIFGLIPLALVCAAAQASPLTYDFGGTANYTCDGSAAACTGGTGPGGSTGGGTFVLSAGSLSGYAMLYTTPSVTYTSAMATGNVTMTWSGTGNGVVPSLLPLSWNFSISDGAEGSAFNWDLQFTLNGQTLYNSGVQTSGTASGATSASTASISSGSAMGAWSTSIEVNFGSSSGGNNLTIAVPQGSTIDLGLPAPEPSTWGMAGTGILFALMLASRKLRAR